MELPIFLTIDEVERIHNNQIELYGGAVGYIDKKRLELAIGAVEAGHAFLDGNKRTGVAVCSIFLLMNGWDLIETFSIDIAVGVANSNVSKQELTEYILSVIRRS